MMAAEGKKRRRRGDETCVGERGEREDDLLTAPIYEEKKIFQIDQSYWDLFVVGNSSSLPELSSYFNGFLLVMSSQN